MRFERTLLKMGWMVLVALLALLVCSLWSTRINGPEFFSEKIASMVADACAVTAYPAMALFILIALKAFHTGWTQSDSKVNREAHKPRTD
jgi:hypothetical protein